LPAIQLPAAYSTVTKPTVKTEAADPSSTAQNGSGGKTDGEKDAVNTVAPATYEITVKPGYDVFGYVTQGKGTPKIGQECKCPQCHRSIAATRFAPHLEKCMGMGRAASRSGTVSYYEN